MEEKKIVEINGIKMEIDLRYAKTINSYKIGDPIKILIKESYSTQYESFSGIIAGFDNFKERPTIIVAYICNRYNESPLKFAYINADTKDTEICPIIDDYITIEKSSVISLMDREIEKTKTALLDMKNKKEYFLRNFTKYFPESN